jgi:hypothetical protein
MLPRPWLSLNGKRKNLRRGESLTIRFAGELFGELRRREKTWGFKELPLR